MEVRSRSGRDISDRFAELAGMADAVGRPALLDGELVAIGRDGRPDFEAVRRRMFSGRPPLVAATFMAFDLLEVDGQPLLSHRQFQREDCWTSSG